MPPLSRSSRSERLAIGREPVSRGALLHSLRRAGHSAQIIEGVIEVGIVWSVIDKAAIEAQLPRAS